MFYDTLYRHNQALAPTGLESVPSALHALNAAVDDCRRAGKSIAADASILLLIRNLASVAERGAPRTNELRLGCAEDRNSVVAGSALLNIAGNSVAGDATAKRTFHRQARLALASLAHLSPSPSSPALCSCHAPRSAAAWPCPPPRAARTSLAAEARRRR